MSSPIPFNIQFERFWKMSREQLEDTMTVVYMDCEARREAPSDARRKAPSEARHEAPSKVPHIRVKYVAK